MLRAKSYAINQLHGPISNVAKRELIEVIEFGIRKKMGNWIIYVQ